MFKFEIDHGKKLFMVSVWGFYTEEVANDFVKKYNEEVKKITPKDYTLVVNPENLTTSKQEMLPILKGCFQFYMQGGFKKIYMITPTSTSSAMQLKRVARETNFTADFINSLEEAV